MLLMWDCAALGITEAVAKYLQVAASLLSSKGSHFSKTSSKSCTKRYSSSEPPGNVVVGQLILRVRSVKWPDAYKHGTLATAWAVS